MATNIIDLINYKLGLGILLVVLMFPFIVCLGDILLQTTNKISKKWGIKKPLKATYVADVLKKFDNIDQYHPKNMKKIEKESDRDKVYPDKAMFISVLFFMLLSFNQSFGQGMIDGENPFLKEFIINVLFIFCMLSTIIGLKLIIKRFIVLNKEYKIKKEENNYQRMLEHSKKVDNILLENKINNRSI